MQCPCCARVSSNKSDKHRARPARALRPGKLYVYWLKIPLRSRIAAARLQGGTLESAFFLLTPVDSKQISYDGAALLRSPHGGRLAKGRSPSLWA